MMSDIHDDTHVRNVELDSAKEHLHALEQNEIMNMVHDGTHICATIWMNMICSSSCERHNKTSTELQFKKQTYQDTCNTFLSKVLPHTDIGKYYPVGIYSLRSLFIRLLYRDIATLKKHFRGILPNVLLTPRNNPIMSVPAVSQSPEHRFNCLFFQTRLRPI